MTEDYPEPFSTEILLEGQASAVLAWYVSLCSEPIRPANHE